MKQICKNCNSFGSDGGTHGVCTYFETLDAERYRHQESTCDYWTEKAEMEPVEVKDGIFFPVEVKKGDTSGRQDTVIKKTLAFIGEFKDAVEHMESELVGVEDTCDDLFRIVACLVMMHGGDIPAHVWDQVQSNKGFSGYGKLFSGYGKQATKDGIKISVKISVSATVGQLSEDR